MHKVSHVKTLCKGSKSAIEENKEILTRLLNDLFPGDSTSKAFKQCEISLNIGFQRVKGKR
tara:strand:+ start:1604 stop:1786 length:183 start_codon:yes stop_codon:yes gene_type:complete